MPGFLFCRGNCPRKSGKGFETTKPDSPDFTQAIGQIALDISAKTFADYI
jgi:hypothetical protein